MNARSSYPWNKSRRRLRTSFSKDIHERRQRGKWRCQRNDATLDETPLQTQIYTASVCRYVSWMRRTLYGPVIMSYTDNYEWCTRESFQSPFSFLIRCPTSCDTRHTPGISSWSDMFSFYFQVQRDLFMFTVYLLSVLTK